MRPRLRNRPATVGGISRVRPIASARAPRSLPSVQTSTLRRMTDLTTQFQHMAVATFVAYRAFMNGETPVACVFVHEPTQKILAFGCNDTNRSLNGTRHAEFVGIDKILAENGLMHKTPQQVALFFRDVVLYVTVEPCVMCALALRHVGVGKVYFGAANDRFGGNGTVIKVQEEDSYVGYGGIMRVEAVHLLRNFYIQENETAPVPKVKKNKEIDGKPFPPNLDFSHYVSERQFYGEYGPERGDQFFHAPHPCAELTPIAGHGYDIRRLVSGEQILCMPHLGDLYPREEPCDGNAHYGALVAHDIEILYDILPVVTATGQVDYDEAKDSKRRKTVA